MKIEVPRLILLTEFESAPDTALFSQEMVAALRDCSLATIERDRWAGTGIPFKKIGRLVRYRKIDIKTWLENHIIFSSTSQAQHENHTTEGTAGGVR